MNYSFVCVLLFSSLQQLHACTDNFGCSLGGRCVDHVCECFRAWKGINCSELNLQATRNIRAFDRPENQSSWGGSVIWENETQTFHMFAADMTEHCGLNSWQHNSAIRHLVSKTPEGPYEPQEIILSSFSHNPTVHKTQSGHYVIYHIGKGVHGSRPLITTCHNGTTPQESESGFQGPPPPIGSIIVPDMIFSESLRGPWSTYASSQKGSSCNNPAAYVFPNGTTLLICKVMSPEIRVMLVAKADSWQGPYHVVAHTNVYGEDAFIWRQPEDGSFHMLLHSMKPTKICTTAWSADGLHWTPAFNANLSTTKSQTYPSYNHTITQTDGHGLVARRRERHQLLLNSGFLPGPGAPVAWLFNGVTTGEKDFSFTSVQAVG